MAELENFLIHDEEEQKEGEAKENTIKEKPNQAEKIDIKQLTELKCLVDKLYSQTAVNQDKAAYQANYDLVGSLSDNEIIGFINNFNEQLVIADPHFYSALIKVAENKKLIRPQFDI